MQMSRCRHGKREPEFARCKTSSVGAIMPGSSKEMFYCDVEDAECRYALPVGYDYVCRHSDNEIFAERDDSNA